MAASHLHPYGEGMDGLGSILGFVSSILDVLPPDEFTPFYTHMEPSSPPFFFLQ